MTSPVTSATAAAAAGEDRQRTRTGLAYGLAAYLSWGFVVFYFKAVAHISPLEVLAHRIVWSLLLLGTLLGVRGRWRDGLAVVRDRRTLGLLLITTGLIAINWFTFIWAVGHDRVLQASLGYYINPLVNVALGFVFLRERPRRAQWIAVVLATVAVAILTWQMGQLPVIALVLAFSFGIYGLLRKTMRAEALVGLAVETTLLLPVAAGYLIWLARNQAMHFGSATFTDDLLLVAAGVVTALPLLWFANAARRLKYTTVGLLQYIAPSLQFLTAVLVFGEALRVGQIFAFGLIWIALAVYTQDAWRQPR